jgi:hypothetical protein
LFQLLNVTLLLVLLVVVLVCALFSESAIAWLHRPKFNANYNRPGQVWGKMLTTTALEGHLARAGLQLLLKPG